MDARVKEYAELAIQIGLNVQKGQKVVIRTPVQCANFARVCAEAAYDAGCAEVFVDFSDAALTRMKYLRGADDIFDCHPQWQAEMLNSLAREGGAVLSIAAEDPDILRGVDPERIRRAKRASGAATKEFVSSMMSNRTRWCVVSAPILPWAAKVFPQDCAQDAMESLWEAIYKTLRITGDGCAVSRWHAHTEKILGRCERLNALQLDTLHYKNSLGTDLSIGLPEGAVWAGGAEKDTNGLEFIANLPTEEIFTAPHRERVQGRVVSSMPFVLNGVVIDRFAFQFEKGKIVSVETEDAEQKAMLQSAISVDAGAAYLGEAALVPFDSPISNLGILFYNTLFDENASCHLAFGKAYPCLEGGGDMSDEELRARGMNDSFTHMDFMIGTEDLMIEGTTRDGRLVSIFENGNFAL